MMFADFFRTETVANYIYQEGDDDEHSLMDHADSLSSLLPLLTVLGLLGAAVGGRWALGLQQWMLDQSLLLRYNKYYWYYRVWSQEENMQQEEMHEADRPVVMNDEYWADELDLFLLCQLRVLGPSADTNEADSGQSRTKSSLPCIQIRTLPASQNGCIVQLLSHWLFCGQPE